ncbi:valine--tRNA ligase [Paraflavitalea pollutisoli]|uniref:valine--tRNA ligase n=1 Tax=Paraflavitalea pollutisoli TaxID=3034143 RepID=UPI0023EAB019|nr:valine--tRNA ligase [Paraflavitalea sp. H1-2-19X]
MELSKNYTPSGIEEKWSRIWKEKRYFNSQPDGRPAFTVVIPPPNVTGVLHMGHTLNETVQDILVRKARMSGFNACWVPGSDHASIATEAKVVQMLEKEKGIKKSDLTREKFLEHAFEWKEKYGNIIYHQIEKLGCSVDWDRVSFTMDPDYYRAVIKVFVDLYNKKLIYRGARMINWDPAAKTALSDEEVEYKELQGKLYYVAYKVVDAVGTPTSDEPIVIATQRPETIMGDTAVCVNPTDERYAHLKGKKVIVPLVNRAVPVIFDEYVDKEFGTGALKVTPAHDINDYNLGLKHNLEIIDTLTEDGKLSEAAQVCVGMDRFDARKEIVRLLQEAGLLIKDQEYTTRLGFSQRTNAVVEPRISTQWFVAMRTLADKALLAVTSGEVRIHPGDKFLATYKYWLENVKDWCISRQLWWGQRIPAFYAPDGTLVVAENKEAALETFQQQGANWTADELTQDDDVLDTWFSSWLWPIEVFKGITHPGNPDINYYYPTSVLVTGQDIIFFWVARMIMAGMEYMDVKPFSDVYFTGMVRDKQGRKMSKSLGNSPDLLKLIEATGADAVRFGIMISSPAGNDLLFDETSPEQGSRFNNKMWNALKLVKMWEARQATSATSEPLPFAVNWFQQRLNEAKADIEKAYGEFKLSEALKILYSLIWDDFCSWYLEWVKPAPEQPISQEVYNKTVGFFSELMQLLHPFMPFVTEELYQLLAVRAEGDVLCIKQLAPVQAADKTLLLEGQLLKDVITGLRDTRAKNNLKPKEAIKLCINTGDNTLYKAIEPILLKQVNAEAVTFVQEPVPNSIASVIGKDKFYITSEQEVDTTQQKATLEKELEYLKGFLLSVEKKLSNERFVQNAKPEVVDSERKKQSDAAAKIAIIEESLSHL